MINMSISNFNLIKYNHSGVLYRPNYRKTLKNKALNNRLFNILSLSTVKKAGYTKSR